MVRVELAVLDGLQCCGQELRHVARREHDAIFAVRGEDASNEQRLETRNRDVLPLAVCERGDRVARDVDDENLRVTLLVVGETRGAQCHFVTAAALVTPGARTIELVDFAILQPGELLFELRTRECETGV